MSKELNKDIYDPQRWGFNSETIADLGNQLHSFWERFKDNFKMKTKNTAGYTWSAPF